MGTRDQGDAVTSSSPAASRRVVWIVIACVAVAAVVIAGLALLGLRPGAATEVQDTDGDSVVDLLDSDADDDGIPNADECDGSAALAAMVRGDTEPQIRPSWFGLQAGDHVGGRITQDVSEHFGAEKGTGAVIMTLENATRHPDGADVFISGVNSSHPGGATRVDIRGTLGLYLDIRHDTQWFDDDIKRIATLDGTGLTNLAERIGYVDEPGFVHTTIVESNGTQYVITGPASTDSPTINYTMYASEVISVPEAAPYPFGFRSVTTAFSFQSDQKNPGLFPVINIIAHSECDADENGIGDRLDPGPSSTP